MIQPSLLNPYKVFALDEPIYWRSNKYGPYRGDYYRSYPTGTNVPFFCTDTVQPVTLQLKKCSDDSTVTNIGVSAPIDGIFVFYGNIAPALVNSNERYYFRIVGNGSNNSVDSELIRFNFPTDLSGLPLTEFEYSNKNTFAGLPLNTPVKSWFNIDFWMRSFPQEYEDVEISAGEFVRVRNEQHRVQKMVTEYTPSYIHEKLKLILSLDTVKINGIEYIQRNEYIFTEQRHYALSKGEVDLTERKSITRNVL